MTATKTRPWTAPNELYFFGEEWNEQMRIPGSELRSYKPTNETYGFHQGRVRRKVATFDKLFRSDAVEHYRRFYSSRLSVTAPAVDWLEDVQFLSSDPSATYQHRLTGPGQFLQKLLQTWRLRQADAVPLLGLEASDTSVAVRLLSGREPLRGRDVKDRIAYLFRIRKALSALFRNEDAENDWLREPHDLLAGQKPITLLLEGSMENLLLVKEYVEAAAGR